MTWIIGATTIWGYGALISDVQVTFRDGSKADLIRKAFPVANYIGAGFAGSVRIGFSLIEELSHHISTYPIPQQESGIDPVDAANQFTPIAREVFSRHPREEKRLGSHLLLVGSSTTEHHAFGSRIYIIRMVSPHFIPGVMGDMVKICSIGNGSQSKVLKRIIRPLVDPRTGIMKAEVGMPGGWGKMFSFSVTRALNDYPIQGVSQHHHLMEIRRGSITLLNNDERSYDRYDNVIELKMPDVAASYNEFLRLCKTSGHTSAEAIG